jgi:UTP-glucose-1-phosphate uridylyltransferase
MDSKFDAKQHPKIRTAVIAVAGLGTRMGTFTQGVPKFMAPVYAGDQARPALDFMLEELMGVGVKRLIFITSGDAEAQLRSYLGPVSEQRLAYLTDQATRDPKKQALNDAELARRQQYADTEIICVDQPVGPYGTAVPLDLARPVLQRNNVERFIFITGDDFIWRHDGRSEWQDALAQWDGESCIILGDAVRPQDVSRYGILFDDGAASGSGKRSLKSITEKPPASQVPPNPMRNISRYLLDARIWPFVAAVMARQPAAGQPEYYITDVVNDAVAAGVRFEVHHINGTYLDCGNPRSTQAAGAYITEHLDSLERLTVH